MERLSLRNETMEEIHERAILLWIHAKQRDEASNPAHGIFFALTNQAWPSHLPEVSNAIDLCSVLSQTFGQPPLSDEEARRLNVRALALFHSYSEGRSPIHFFGALVWANRLGYLLAAIALFVRGASWLVIGLTVAVWLCFGAARTAARMGKEEKRPSWEVPVVAAMHIVALVSLYAASGVLLMKQ